MNTKNTTTNTTIKNGNQATKNTSDAGSEKSIEELKKELAETQSQLQQAKEAQFRSQADYQNLQRRTQEEKIKFMAMATKELIANLLEPLDHLSMAASQLKDKGLDMTIAQLWSVLEQHGLKEIDVLHKPFDVNQMEVVQREGAGEIVIGIVKRGYTLNGAVVQHAKVIVGDYEPHTTS